MDLETQLGIPKVKEWQVLKIKEWTGEGDR
jgi:hypothetical protein